MVETVTINSSHENAGPSLEEEAAAMDAAAATQVAEEELPSEEAPAEERPEWLPEKFKSAEDLAKAYAELEKKQSAPRKEETNQAPADLTDEDARGMVEDAGLDFQALAAEFWSNGELSDASYNALQDAGIPKEVVDGYVQAQLSNLEAQREAIMGEVQGGSYDDLTAWALDNLDGEEIDAYNRIMETNDMVSIKMAVRGLVARRSAVEGFEPARSLSGSDAASLGGTYESVSQLTKDMNDPRYAKDPAFRAKVEAKLGRSNIF